jgi:hypothetical protein
MENQVWKIGMNSLSSVELDSTIGDKCNVEGIRGSLSLPVHEYKL